MSGILIVDDDPTIRAMFARALQSLGEIETSANGAEALRLLNARKYGVILLDLHMPVIDGFVILQTLANKPGPNRDTPVYVVTADTSDQARIRALRRHAVFFLTKPVPIGTLTSLVDATLKKSAARAASPRISSLPRESRDTPSPPSPASLSALSHRTASQPLESPRPVSAPAESHRSPLPADAHRSASLPSEPRPFGQPSRILTPPPATPKKSGF